MANHIKVSLQMVMHIELFRKITHSVLRIQLTHITKWLEITTDSYPKKGLKKQTDDQLI